MNKASAQANVEQPARLEEQDCRSRRREEILSAAFEEFAAGGYAEAHLEAVARRAHVAKGTIYLYFESKEVLFRAVLRRLIHPLFEQLETFVRTFSGPAEDLLRNVVARQYAEAVKNGETRAMLRLLIAESHRFPELSEIYLREIIAPGTVAMRLLMERGIASGEFRESKIINFPQILVGPAILAVIWQLTLGERQRLNLDEYMEAHLELLLHGLCGARGTTPAEPMNVANTGEKR
jgi:AcrR family transcriptional regulator